MISEELIQQFVKETELFEERIQAFEAGEIDRKTFKGISGRFGCYAQREKNYMLRLFGGDTGKLPVYQRAALESAGLSSAFLDELEGKIHGCH